MHEMSAQPFPDSNPHSHSVRAVVSMRMAEGSKHQRTLTYVSHLRSHGADAGVFACSDADGEAAAYLEELVGDGPSTSAWVEDAAAWDCDLEQRRFEVRRKPCMPPYKLRGLTPMQTLGTLASGSLSADMTELR